MKRSQLAETHTLAVLVENKAGVLARVAGLFARRGFNIDSLAVAPTDERFSRITIVVDAESAPIDQIKKQLDKLINVVEIVELQRAVVRRTEVCVDDRLVLTDRRRWPFGDDAAFGHHDHPVGDLLHHVHVVFDEEHGHALITKARDVAEQRLSERRIDARHRLVEHHHLRFDHERASHLEELALAA